MGLYAKLIADLKLVKELKKSKGRDDIPEEDIAKLVALVNDAADVAGPLLERIPVTFKQYTEHNIRHCRNLIDLMGRFIPRETLRQMNGLELCVLILSALLHDFGMFVSEEEKRAALDSPEFDSFLLGHHDRATALEEAWKKGDQRRAEIIQDALLAEYFRRMHPERARTNVLKNLPGKLVYGDVDISEYVLDVCESHAWGVHESSDPKYLNKTVSRLSTNKAVYNVPLNLQYVACCLRLADIMDFDRSRTPVVVFQNIDFTEAKSWEEWNKHLSVKGWVINEREVLFRAECKHPAFYVAVMEFLDWVDDELSECRRLVVKESPKDIAERYKLHLPPVVDRSEVEMEDKSYLAGAFRFQLEYERIMKLMMDKSLYPDPSLFLRELLQNSLDACRNREAHAKDAGRENLYTPRIAVWDFSDDRGDPRIVFQDNGVGMSRKIVENYFMRVGRSYYRSPEFDAERARLKKKDIDLEATSQFGIGILSCFMVADRFEVETYRTGHQPLHITIEGPTKYFTIKLLPEPPRADFNPEPATDLEDGPPHRPGTRITVHFRPGTTVEIIQTLLTFAVNIDYDITVYCSGTDEPQTIPRRRWESEELLTGTLNGAINTDRYSWRAKPASGRVRETATKFDIVKNLEGVLVPSRIPFEKYDFSKNLKGNAWFWLLTSESGGVCARRGDLQIRYDLNVAGLPALLRHISGSMQVTFESREWKTFLEILKRSALDGKSLTAGASAYGDILRVFGPFASREAQPDAEQTIKLWGQLTRTEQQDAYKSLKLLNDDAQVWYEVAGVPLALMYGNRQWVDQPLRFDWDLMIETFPQSLALHGALLPAGFVKWEPMSGKSESLRLLDLPSGVLVDMRGQSAPRPIASRLSVLWTEGREVATSFLRATLYHVLELISSDPTDDNWHDWLSYLWFSLRNLHFWPEVIQQEYELLEGRLRYAAFVNGEYRYLSQEQLFDTFGRWVPIRSLYLGNDGLYAYEESTVLMIIFKARRERDDGVWEVDMRSKVNVADDTLEKPILQLQQEILYR